MARPAGGLRDVEELLHELGHALAFSAIAPHAAWEDRLLWWDSVAETFAFLCGGLVRNRGFLNERMGIGPKAARSVAAFTSFSELFLVRRYCAKVLFELDFLSSDANRDVSESAALEMHSAVGVETTSARILAETETAFYSIDYLRAWLLEVRLRRSLKARIGKAWWRDFPRDPVIKSLWGVGGGLTLNQLIVATGHDRLDPFLLAQDLVTGCAT